MAKAEKTRMVRIYNCSNQLIAVQVRPPGADFYTSESQVRLMPGQDTLLPHSHLRWEQIENLQKRRMLKVVYDSKDAGEKEAARGAIRQAKDGEKGQAAELQDRRMVDA